jgi:CHAD domain-containing protein
MPRIHHLQLSGRSSVAANAARVLPRLAVEYFAHVRKLLDDSSKPKDLHRIRLATKQFRYTLELFRPCYDSGLESRIASLREVQKLLGDTNDSVASWAMLSKLMPKTPQRAKVRDYLKKRAEHDAADFRKEWKEKFDAPGREHWWKAYLKNGIKSS